MFPYFLLSLDVLGFRYFTAYLSQFSLLLLLLVVVNPLPYLAFHYILSMLVLMIFCHFNVVSLNFLPSIRCFLVKFLAFHYERKIEIKK